MASNSGRKSGSSGRSNSRKRVVIGASETTRVRYNKGKPEVNTERKTAAQRSGRASDPGRSTQATAFARTKREERERRQKQQRFKVVGVWAGAVIAVLAVVFGAVALYNSQAFAIKRVDVRGLTRVPKSEVLKRAAIPSGSTLLRVDTGAVRDELLKSAWVSNVQVKREFPDVLVIDVRERAPVARVLVGEEQWLAAEDGTWMARIPKGAKPPAGVLLIKNVPALTPKLGTRSGSAVLLNALSVAAQLAEPLRARVAYVNAPDVDKTSLFTKSGIEIIIGRAEEMQRKTTIVERILAEQRGNVVYINVRTTDRPTWRGLEN